MGTAIVDGTMFPRFERPLLGARDQREAFGISAPAEGKGVPPEGKEGWHGKRDEEGDEGAKRSRSWAYEV